MIRGGFCVYKIFALEFLVFHRFLACRYSDVTAKVFSSEKHNKIWKIKKTGKRIFALSGLFLLQTAKKPAIGSKKIQYIAVLPVKFYFSIVENIKQKPNCLCF